MNALEYLRWLVTTKVPLRCFFISCFRHLLSDWTADFIWSGSDSQSSSQSGSRKGTLVMLLVEKGNVSSRNSLNFLRLLWVVSRRTKCLHFGLFFDCGTGELWTGLSCFVASALWVSLRCELVGEEDVDSLLMRVASMAPEDLVQV